MQPQQMHKEWQCWDQSLLTFNEDVAFCDIFLKDIYLEDFLLPAADNSAIFFAP